MVLKLFRDGYTFRGHNYLGPGNTIYKDDEPVDEVDFDAYVHDLDYELATKTKEIREAITAFVDDYKKNGSLAELSGIVGLSLKYGFESVFGVTYPSMSSKSKTLNQLIYATRERHLVQEWNNIKNQPDKGGYSDFTDFKKKSRIAHEIYESYRTGGYYYSALKRDFDATEANTRSDNEPPTKRPRSEEDSDSNNPSEVDTTFIEKHNHRNSINTNMDVDQENIHQQSGSGRGPNTGAMPAVTGSGDSTSSSITWIKPSTPCSNNFMNFSKTKILISYGYSTENIQTSETIDQISTPMALIPVDFLPFYLSEAEFDMLPTTAQVMKVTCQVTPLGTRTAFDVGSTISGTATSELFRWLL